MRVNCPVCQRKITWRYRFFRSANAIGLRKPFPGTHCDNIVIWSKWPYRTMSLAVYWMLIAVLIAYLTKSVVMEIATWAGIGLVFAGALKAKFEVVH